MNDGDQPAGSAERLLFLLGEHADGLRERLDDEQYALLLARLEDLVGTDPDDDRALRRALRGVHLALLPLPLDHPVYRALDSVRLVASAPPGPTTVTGARELLARLTPPGPQPSPGPQPVPAGAAEEDRLLLGAPALTAGEARERCGGAPPPELIRLRDPRNGDRYPRFQFGADGGGAPYGVVLEVNRLLLADVDPWGAAAWWLGDNAWLGGAPASLLGELPDHRLVGAAKTLAEGEG
jgi:hypothetical protein